METGEKPVKVKQSFDELYKEIVYFINCVDNEYYACANRIISKKERSSWRFKVKRYYKELNSIPFNEQNGIVATTLLIEIFKRLSIGSNRLLFVNWETFKALGVSQTEYYDTIINRIIARKMQSKVKETLCFLIFIYTTKNILFPYLSHLN